MGETLDAEMGKYISTEERLYLVLRMDLIMFLKHFQKSLHILD